MKIVEKLKSNDGSIKYALEVPARRENPNDDKKIIEAALVYVPNREDKKPKYILCLSSQVGCVYDCQMCANAGKPFYRCLTPNEINAQIDTILKEDGNMQRISKEGLVEYAFMGIGEPLFGTNVINAIKDHKKYFPDTRFAITTVGQEGTIKHLTNASISYPTRLELSLHFPNDAIRNQYMNSVWLDGIRPVLNIKAMFDEAQEFVDKRGGKVTVNYALIDGLNNTSETLDQLVNIMIPRRKNFYVKFMEPNHTWSFVESHKDDLGIMEDTLSIEEMRRKLEENKIHTTFFDSKGKDIRAGCGMMKLK